jgi:hypothetical protein
MFAVELPFLRQPLDHARPILEARGVDRLHQADVHEQLPVAAAWANQIGLEAALHFRKRLEVLGEEAVVDLGMGCCSANGFQRSGTS